MDPGDGSGTEHAPDDLALTLGFVDGAHGQDLLDAGRAAEVLNASGRILARIHGLDATGILPGMAVEAGDVLVHGDFGPNNLLFDPDSLQVVAVLDWEWAHVGRPIEDLAWCEWIVRMHHPEQVSALNAFFEVYGTRPAWAQRQAAMVARCRGLIGFCERWEPGGDGVRQWRESRTMGWHRSIAGGIAENAIGDTHVPPEAWSSRQRATGLGYPAALYSAQVRWCTVSSGACA